MKVTLLILVFCFSIIQIVSNEKPTISLKLKEAFENKCVTHGQDKHYFKKILDETLTFVKVALALEPPNPITQHNKFCKYLKQSQLYAHVKNITTELLPCLDRQEAYFQRFVLNAIRSGYEELCGPRGISNTKYLYDKFTRTGECVVYGTLQSWDDTCTPSLTFFKNMERGVINLNKKNLCLDLQSLQNCATGVIEGQCNNEDFLRFTDLFFKPFLDQCDGSRLQK